MLVTNYLHQQPVNIQTQCSTAGTTQKAASDIVLCSCTPFAAILLYCVSCFAWIPVIF